MSVQPYRGGESRMPAPSLKNHFNINVGDEYTSYSYNYAIGPNSSHLVAWQNPHLKQVITPYIPSGDDTQFISACSKIFTENFNMVYSKHCTPPSWNSFTKTWDKPPTTKEPSTLSSGATLFFLPKITVRILPALEESVKCLVIFSRVNKSAYALAKNHLESKPDAYWQAQLSNKLPAVNILPSNLCVFSARRQFEIVSSRLHAEAKPYVAKLERNESTCQTLKANLQKTAAEEKEKFLKTVDSDDDSDDDTTMPTFIPRSDCQYNRSQLKSISGEDYDAVSDTSTFLGTGSQQWHLERAIKTLIPQAFNDQSKFEQVIQQSETVSNTSSANSNAMNVDSENVYNGPLGVNAGSDDDVYSSDEDPPQQQTLIPLKTPIQLLPKEKNQQQ